MKVFIFVFVTLIAVVLSAPPQAQHNPSGDATIVHSESEVGTDSFSYAFETSDRQAAEAKGKLQNIGSDHESLAVTGSFSFIGDDGHTYIVTYTADENGFQPQGSHLPVAPEA